MVQLTSSSQTSIKWLSRSGLKDFVGSREKPRFGILQRFVRPSAAVLHHETLRTSWSYHYQTADMCRNRMLWADPSKDLGCKPYALRPLPSAMQTLRSPPSALGHEDLSPKLHALGKLPEGALD